MTVRAVVRSQFHAALAMLQQCIEECPDALWDDPGEKTKFWQVAYHALFYTHLYLQKAEGEFVPWIRHHEKYHSLEETPSHPYSRKDLLDYLTICNGQVDEQTAWLDPEAPSGFFWLPFNKLELQFYNVRHIQQHTGELMERLGARAGIELNWVGTKTE